MRTSTILTPLALALILAAAPAQAENLADTSAGQAAQYAGGCPASGLTVILAAPSQQAGEYERLVAEYRAKASAMRREIWARHAELTALSGNANADPAHLETLADKIRALQAELDSERTRFHEDLAELDMEAGTGTSRGYARFGGPGPKGSMRGSRHGHGCSSGCPATTP